MAFKESEHPRDKDGKFTDGKNGSDGQTAEEIAKEIFPHLTEDEKNDKITSNEENTEKPKVIAASIYVNSADPLNQYASRIKPIDGYEDMVMHGGPDSVELQDLDGKPINSYTAQEFAEWLKDDPNYHGGDIRLVSCSTGAKDDGFAQCLADCLGVSVMAPTRSVWISFDGTMTVGRTPTSNDGRWRVFKPKKGNDL